MALEGDWGRCFMVERKSTAIPFADSHVSLSHAFAQCPPCPSLFPPFLLRRLFHRRQCPQELQQFLFSRHLSLKIQSQRASMLLCFSCLHFSTPVARSSPTSASSLLFYAAISSKGCFLDRFAPLKSRCVWAFPWSHLASPVVVAPIRSSLVLHH